MNFPSGDVTQARDMLFRLNPNGQGSLGTVSLTGFVGTAGTTVTQTVNNAAYSFANGAMTLGFGSGPLITGNALCYLSADGNFFFGGSATGWDMIVGVRAIAGSVPPDALKGTYYQAGADVTPAGGFATLATYYGAFSAGSGTIVGHQRLLTSFGFRPELHALRLHLFGLVYGGRGRNPDDFLGIHNVVGAGRCDSDRLR